MFSITVGRFFLFKAPTDMRKSFDGLCGLVTNQMQLNVMRGDVFVFINRSRNRMKLLRWESGGLVLFYKRLEKGTFPLPKEGGKADLSYDGYCPKKVCKKKKGFIFLERTTNKLKNEDKIPFFFQSSRHIN